LPADYWDKYPQRINALPPKTFSARRANITIRRGCKSSRRRCGENQDALAKYGSIETFDADGKPSAR
jgi:hypothetical protein